MPIRETIPWVMAAGRATLGPLLVLGASCGWNGVALAGMVVAALVSDIFDGILARRWRCDTAPVRLFDSMADTFFYLCVACALAEAHPSIWRDNARLFYTLLALEVCRFAFDFGKFGKPACYHSYLAKAWGLVLATAVTGTFALGRVLPLIPLALGLGIVCLVEGVAMSAILPMWSRDVKTLHVALARRRAYLAAASSTRDLAREAANRIAYASGACIPPAGGASRSTGRTATPFSCARSSSSLVRPK